jgi:LPXTG-site transpeptidase (sortase) family protein
MFKRFQIPHSKIQNPRSKSFGYWLGTGLMIVGAMGLFWTFYPILREEILFRLGQTQIVSANDQTYTIYIPSIGVSAPVVAGVDPFSRHAYLEALKQGIAQAKGTALPGEPGTQYLFAHSSDAPWRMTRENTAFYRLGRVKASDLITVTYQGNQYQYRVTGMKTVWPKDVNYLKDLRTNQLILQTCTPIGTDWKRLLVFAEPIE